MSHVNELIENFIEILNEGKCDVWDRVDNAGELLQYLDKAGAEKALVRLGRPNGERFTLDNYFSIQIGCVAQNMQPVNSAVSEFGGLYRTLGLSYRYDLILFVPDSTIDISIDRLVNAFSQAQDCMLLSVELNPVQVVMRYALVHPTDIGSYPPDLRAYAFSYSVQTFTSKY